MKKSETSDKSFQLILFRKMDAENQQVIYCEDDGEYTIFCTICHNLWIERFYKIHLESQTHTKKIYKREELNK